MRAFYTPILCLMSFSASWHVGVECKRGPHHPHSEIDTGRAKLDQHLAHEAEHMQEDLKTLSIDEKKVDDMDEDEKNFYYFKLHDTDNNNALDGLELYQAATHHQNANSIHPENEAQNELGHIIDVIDDFIAFADVNYDGYLDYPEYATAITKTTTESSNKSLN